MSDKLDNEDSSDDVIAEINIIPFVDIVLVILVIFMVTSAAIVRASMRVELPQAAAGSASVDSICSASECNRPASKRVCVILKYQRQPSSGRAVRMPSCMFMARVVRLWRSPSVADEEPRVERPDVINRLTPPDTSAPTEGGPLRVVYVFVRLLSSSRRRTPCSAGGDALRR